MLTGLNDRNPYFDESTSGHSNYGDPATSRFAKPVPCGIFWVRRPH